MLRQLYIKNFTLIDELDIELHPGFSVITGETGAGKSIILGAIGLLLGQRADSKSIKTGAEKCVIEAHFDLSRYPMQEFFDENEIEQDAADTIVRRELTSAGKSRAFINDTPVSLSMLKELGPTAIAATTAAAPSRATASVRYSARLWSFSTTTTPAATPPYGMRLHMALTKHATRTPASSWRNTPLARRISQARSAATTSSTSTTTCATTVLQRRCSMLPNSA